MGKEETHMAARILVAVAVLALGAASPAAASGPVSPACYAEVSPRVVRSGTVGQSFTVTVENGPSLPEPIEIEQINAVRAVTPFYLPETGPPIEMVTATSASGPTPWTARIAGSPSRILYEGGTMSLGDEERFAIVGDVANETGTFDWIVQASGDSGQSARFCQPTFSGALDITVT